MRAVLFDMDGVLYEGDRAVCGAAEAVSWFQRRHVPHLFVTNTTSKPREALVGKLARMGIDTQAERIFTPPVAAVRWLAETAPGPVALFVPEATKVEFAELTELDSEAKSGAAAVVLGDLGRQWSFETLNRAFCLLMCEPSPVLLALGMTRYWRTPDGLQLDVAPFVSALECATGAKAQVLGKPATAFFEAALQLLDADPAETLLIGDDIVGDVQGAQRANLAGILVRTGKFRASDLAGSIRPDGVLDSIAELRPWWEAHSHG